MSFTGDDGVWIWLVRFWWGSQDRIQHVYCLGKCKTQMWRDMQPRVITWAGWKAVAISLRSLGLQETLVPAGIRIRQKQAAHCWFLLDWKKNYNYFLILTKIMINLRLELAWKNISPDLIYTKGKIIHQEVKLYLWKCCARFLIVVGVANWGYTGQKNQPVEFPKLEWASPSN